MGPASCAGAVPASSDEPGADAPASERPLTVLDAWMKAQRQLRQGMTMREIVRQEFEDIYPGEVEQAGS